MQTNTFEHHIHIHVRKEDCAFLTLTGNENNILRAKVLRAGYGLSLITSKTKDKQLVTYFMVDHQKRGQLKETAQAYALELNATLVFVQANGDFSRITPQGETCLGVFNYGREQMKSSSLCNKTFEPATLLATITQVAKAELVSWQSSITSYGKLSKGEAYSAAMFARLALTDNPSEKISTLKPLSF